MKISFFKKINKSGIRLNRRVVTFLFCIVVSAFFWLLLSLSKEDSIEINFPVKYINSPADKVIANQLPESIDIEIKSSGIKLLIYKLKKKNESILIDIKDAKPMAIRGHYFLLTNSRIDKITSQFTSDIKIIKIYPDTIFIEFNKKIFRTVPVKSNLKIAFDQHNLRTDSIKLSPAFIRISGASTLIDKINYVETEPVNLKNSSDSLSIKLNILKTPALKFVELSQSKVRATVYVTKYTEASIDLPIEVENLPKGFGLKIFPDKVSIKYDVAFQNYGKINAIEFRAVVNYSKIEPGSNKLKVQLLKYPSEIRAVRMYPEKVEYIIRK